MRAARAYLNVTAVSGTGGLTLTWRGYDKVSGLPAVVSTAAAAITATGLYVYELGTSISSTPEGAVQHGSSRPLPVQWDIQIVHSDGSSYTYSLSVETA